MPSSFSFAVPGRLDPAERLADAGIYTHGWITAAFPITVKGSISLRNFLGCFVLFLTMVIAAGCGSSGTSQPAPPSTTPSVPQVGHVVLLLEENHSYSTVIGNPAMPFLNGLATKGGLATNYFANSHPSIGNYFMLTTGQMITQDDTFTSTVDADNIVREILASGKTWKSYAESLPSVGYTGGDVFPYLEHHNPFSYFSDVRNNSVQVNNLVPFTQFTTDLANNQLPNFSFIVPNAEHSAHDCPDGGSSCTDTDMLAAADMWLQTNIQPLLSSTTFQQNGILVIAFDESDFSDSQNGGGHVVMAIVSAKAKSGFQSNTFYQHQSTFRLLLEALGSSARPGAAANAPDMVEFFP
jgi:phosphatidylinositol-3-phosphatase